MLAKLNEYSETEITKIPDRLRFIVRDVAIKRFNRINSEGTVEDSEEKKERLLSGTVTLKSMNQHSEALLLGRYIQAKG